MSAITGFASWTGGMVMLSGLNLEALLMYALVAFVIGLIAWNKYNEAPVSDPYPPARPGEDLPESGRADAVSSEGAVPVARTGVSAGEEP